MNEEKLARPELAEVFKFKPKWWWDPIPWWLFERLDAKAIVRLALVQLELEQTTLEAQLKANKQAIDVVNQLAK